MVRNLCVCVYGCVVYECVFVLLICGVCYTTEIFVLIILLCLYLYLYLVYNDVSFLYSSTSSFIYFFICLFYLFIDLFYLILFSILVFSIYLFSCYAIRKQGDYSDRALLLCKGRLESSLEEEGECLVLEEISVGHLVGEYGLINNTVRQVL